MSVAWRAGLATRGWFSQDEFVIAAQVLDTRLDADYLLRTFNNHLMPGGLLVAWAMVRAAGFVTWPWVLLLAVGQAATGIAVYRLLRDLLRPGWGLLIPLCLFVFSPLTLEVSSLWLVGLLVLPMQLALVMAVDSPGPVRADRSAAAPRGGRAVGGVRPALRHQVPADRAAAVPADRLPLHVGWRVAQPGDGGPPALAGLADAFGALSGAYLAFY